jgi:ribosomal protein L6P/L9E
MLNFLKSKSFEKVHFEKIKFCFFKMQRCLIVKLKDKKEKIFFVSNDLSICIKKDCIVFFWIKNSTENKSFFINFNTYLSKKIEKRKIFIKGLGIKVQLKNKLKHLELKLGFSHIVFLQIPKTIKKVSASKKVLSIQSSNKVAIGNFLSKIRFLKLPDDYKGKGFYYKYQKEKLKIIKKK